MMKEDNRTTESFSAQEDLQELEEQALEGVTGGGLRSGLKGFFKGCIACGAPKGKSNSEASNGQSNPLARDADLYPISNEDRALADKMERTAAWVDKLPFPAQSPPQSPDRGSLGSTGR